MKTFKFGQLLAKEDICDREKEIKLLAKICKTNGRAIVYGPRRYGKTSVVKNVIIEDFLNHEKSFAIYADLFQLDSVEDLCLRLQVALELALAKRAKVKSFLQSIQNYLKHFRVEISTDPLSGVPSISFSGQHLRSEKTLSELFSVIKDLSNDYKTLLVFDEFQDIRHVSSLEAKLRSEIQNLTQTGVIVLGSKSHILRDIFHDETKPFYGFGIDIEFGKIPVDLWLPYIQDRFAPAKLSIHAEGASEIVQLMRNVPNAIQELCQWIVLQEETGLLTPSRIHEQLVCLIENKSSRYLERLASLTIKEKKVLIAVAKLEPVSSIASTQFLQATHVSATATKATMFRLTDYGILDQAEDGYWITDPIFSFYLKRQFGT